MSDTPRTDQVVWCDSEAECDVVSADFARDLERECEANRVLASQNQVMADNYLKWFDDKCNELRDLRSEMLDRIAFLQDQIQAKDV